MIAVVSAATFALLSSAGGDALARMYENPQVSQETIDLLRQIAEGTQVRYASGRGSQQDILKAVVEITRLHEENRERDDILIVPHIGGRRADIRWHEPALEPAIEIASRRASAESHATFTTSPTSCPYPAALASIPARLVPATCMPW